MKRYYVSIIDKGSDWYNEAVKVLNNVSQKESVPYRVMSRLTDPGAHNVAGVTEEEGPVFSAWAKSLGFEPSITFKATSIREVE